MTSPMPIQRSRMPDALPGVAQQADPPPQRSTRAGSFSHVEAPEGCGRATTACVRRNAPSRGASRRGRPAGPRRRRRADARYRRRGRRAAATRGAAPRARIRRPARDLGRRRRPVDRCARRAARVALADTGDVPARAKVVAGSRRRARASRRAACRHPGRTARRCRSRASRAPGRSSMARSLPSPDRTGAATVRAAWHARPGARGARCPARRVVARHDPLPAEADALRRQADQPPTRAAQRRRQPQVVGDRQPQDAPHAVGRGASGRSAPR